MQSLISLAVFTVIVGTALGQTPTTVAPKVLMPEITEVTNGTIEGQIIGGTPASWGTLPWQAAIFITTSSGTYFCGGSLIDKSWILTAAHCTVSGTSFKVRLGSLSPYSGGTVFTSTVAYTHLTYNPANLNNDIGLIKLPSPVELSTSINVIKILPKPFACGSVLRTYNISGWGKTSDSATYISPELMKAYVNESDSYKCLTTYGASVVVPTVICATGTPEPAICSGDSGGALVLQFGGSSPAYQVGIVSFGAAKGCSLGFPQGFTRATMYLEWMLSITGIYF